MKKILISSLIFSVIGMANEYTQADRILDMQKMAQAMQDIQSGFFYNNLDIVKAGSKDLSETIVKIGPIKAEKENKDVYERWMNDHNAMTTRTQRRIRNYAKTLVERFQDGDPVQALQVYSRISAECMKCHVDLRKW